MSKDYLRSSAFIRGSNRFCKMTAKSMKNNTSSNSRREFLKKSAAATTALGVLSVPRAVHAGSGETLRYGLIGCGKRGSGAAVDAMKADPQVKLVAMGDTFEESALAARDSIKRYTPK